MEAEPNDTRLEICLPPKADSAPILVTHIITSLGSGGAEGVLARLATTPGPVRHRIVSLIDDGLHGETLRAGGVPVLTLGMKPAGLSPLPWLRLIRELRRTRPDIVMTWLYHADLIGSVTALLTGRRTLVWNVRCSNMDLSRYSRLTGWIVGILARMSALPRVIVANSDAGQRHHRQLGYHPRAWLTIPNGFDLPDPKHAAAARQAVRSEWRVSGDEIVVGMVARVDAMKNHPGFLAAAARAAEADSRLRFVLIGRGTDDPAFGIAAAAARLGLGERTLLLGERRDVGRLLSGLDLLVSASTFGEGLSNAIGEAMAAALPCIATDVGDAAALVGESGKIVPPGDDPALAQAILDLAGLPPDRRQTLADAARARIRDHYSVAKMVADYTTLFTGLARRD